MRISEVPIGFQKNLNAAIGQLKFGTKRFMIMKFSNESDGCFPFFSKLGVFIGRYRSLFSVQDKVRCVSQASFARDCQHIASRVSRLASDGDGRGERAAAPWTAFTVISNSTYR